jgi:hypothetical protein
MIIKQTFYKIALLPMTMILMLVSIVSEATFTDNIIFKINPTSQSVDFLKFPVYRCNQGSCDKSWDKACGKCPTCPQWNCPTCAAPALSINKAASHQVIMLQDKQSFTLTL